VRNQALGIGLVSLSFFISFLSGEFDIPFLTSGSLGFWLVPIFLYIAVVFYWADVSARAAKRSDPLLRDSLHWSKLRLFIWSQILAVVLFYAIVALYNAAFAVPEIEAILITLVGIAAAFEMLVVSALLLLLAARRSGDKTLQKHLKWFGLFVLSITVASVVAGVTYPNHHVGLGLVIYLALPLGAYCVYRSTRSLAPLNRLSLEP
jgi:hypothetical protein